MRTKFTIRLRNSRAELPATIWHGIPVFSERWRGADSLEVEVVGDGSDLKALIDRRTDTFSFLEEAESQA